MFMMQTYKKNKYKKHVFYPPPFLTIIKEYLTLYINERRKIAQKCNF